MGGVVSVINPGFLLSQIVANIITVAVAVSVIGSVIGVGVMVAQIPATDTGSSDLLHDQRVVLQSTSSLVFNRMIKVYETAYYYNATETLFMLVQGLDDHLRKAFPDTFVKIVVSKFTGTPVLDPNTSRTKRRRRRHNILNNSVYDSPRSVLFTSPTLFPTRMTSETSLLTTLKTASLFTSESINKASETSTQSTSNYNSPTSSPSTTFDTSFTSNIDKISPSVPNTPEITSSYNPNTSSSDFSQSPAMTTDTSAEISSTDTIATIDELSTDVYSSYGLSTNIFSTFSSIFSFFTTTTTTTPTVPETTTTQDNINTSCDTSQFNGTDNKLALVSINGILYFNTSKNLPIDTKSIISVLEKFTPDITVANKRRQPSTAPSKFNAELSKVEPPAVVPPNDATFNAPVSIPLSILNETQTVVIPDTEFVATTPATLPTTTSTTTTVEITPLFP